MKECAFMTFYCFNFGLQRYKESWNEKSGN